jgi:hypothetical protein
MSEKENKDHLKERGKKLVVFGIVLAILGIGIINIHNPLRGSGLGTLSLVTGIVLAVVGVVRLRKNKV